MISRIKKLTGFVVLLVALAALPGCAIFHRETVAPTPDLKPKQIADEIERCQEVVRKHGDLPKRTDTHLQRARLYSSYKNQKPDYEQALEELEAYLSLNPAEGEHDEIQNWLALLREIVKVNEENKKSKQKINQLAKENKDLKGAVEQLKNLDIQMEERRKQVK